MMKRAIPAAVLLLAAGASRTLASLTGDKPLSPVEGATSSGIGMLGWTGIAVAVIVVVVLLAKLVRR